MKKFMDKDFILETPTAVKLFDACKDLPIVDYHCHLSPKEIYDNPTYTNITQLWLNGDHYKWRLMRACGVEEKYVTGDGSDYEKFYAFASSMPYCIGNPVYHWAHLELQRYFGVELTLCAKNAKAIWDMTCEKLANGVNSVRGFIEASNVEAVCTTDDPADSLEYHIALKNEGDFKVKVLPTFRPDKAFGIEKPDYPEYIAKLSQVSGIEIKTAGDLIAALYKRLDFFRSVGCVISDQAFTHFPYLDCTEEQATQILQKRLGGGEICATGIEMFSTFVMTALAKKYYEYGMAMQLHVGALRNNNTAMFEKLGPDTGFDSVADNILSEKLSGFFKNLGAEVPKTIFYSLNPNDFYVMATMCGNFQKEGTRSYMQLGTGWWFLDHIDGMTQQMRTLADVGVLGNFIGMLTDSRSFLSYPRHEYFRRIMCNLIASYVESGLYPCDEDVLTEVVRGICYNNVKAYLGI